MFYIDWRVERRLPGCTLLAGKMGRRSTSSQKLEIHKNAARSKSPSILLEVVPLYVTHSKNSIHVRVCLLAGSLKSLVVGPGLISPSAVAQDQSQPLIQYHDLLQLLSAAIIDIIIHRADQCSDPESWSKRKQRSIAGSLWGCSPFIIRNYIPLQ